MNVVSALFPMFPVVISSIFVHISRLFVILVVWKALQYLDDFVIYSRAFIGVFSSNAAGAFCCHESLLLAPHKAKIVALDELKDKNLFGNKYEKHQF